MLERVPGNLSKVILLTALAAGCRQPVVTTESVPGTYKLPYQEITLHRGNEYAYSERTRDFHLTLSKLPGIRNRTELDDALAHRSQNISRETLENVQRSTVIVATEQDKPGYHPCTGIHIGEGKIATAYHCVEHISRTKPQIHIRTSDNNWFEARQIRVFPPVDAAVLIVDKINQLANVSVRDIIESEIGNTLYIYSNLISSDLTVTGANNSAIYSGSDRNGLSFMMTFESETIKDGYSGSGVVNDNGELVGILTTKGSIVDPDKTFHITTAVRSGFIEALAR